MSTNEASVHHLPQQCQTYDRNYYDDVIMTMLASHITSLTVVYSIVYLGVDQRKHQSSASLSFVRGIHRGPVNSPHKWPVTRKMFPFDDVIMKLMWFTELNTNRVQCMPRESQELLWKVTKIVFVGRNQHSSYGHMGCMRLRTNFAAESRVVTWSCGDRSVSKETYCVAYNLTGVWRITF